MADPITHVDVVAAHAPAANLSGSYINYVNHAAVNESNIPPPALLSFIATG